MAKVKINGIEWTIVELSLEDLNKAYELIKPDVEYNAYGFINYKDAEILITSELNNDRFRKILSHELTHAFFDAYITSDPSKIYLEEDVADFVSRHAFTIVELTNEYVENRNK